MKVLITGGGGFVGHNLVLYLRKNTDHDVIVPSKEDMNLFDAFDYHDGLKNGLVYYFSQCDAVIHLAGVVGGIGFNKDNQGKLGYENLQMGLNVLEACRLAKVKKLVVLGTTCSYPHSPKTIPFIEEELFDGMPEITNSGYGIAKRTLVKLGIEYASQYNMDITHLIPTNMYGPHDHFEEEKSHVIPALIKKFENPVKGHEGIDSILFSSVFTLMTPKYINVWGNGTASRDFLHVQDCCRAISIALEKNTGPQPINLGNGEEITIKDLVETIKQVGEYDAQIIWEVSKPNGQPRRCLDIKRAMKVLKWLPHVDLKDGLKETIQWYRNTK